MIFLAFKFSTRRCKRVAGDLFSKSGAAVTVVGLLVAAPIAAQQPPDRGGTTYSFSATPFYQPEVDISGGGRFTLSSAIVAFGATRSVSDTVSTGLTLKYERDDYNFAEGGEFADAKPWNEVHRFGFSIPIFARFENNWSLGVTPSVDWLQEEGADADDSLSFGTTVFAFRSFSRDRRIGLGAGVFRDVDDDTRFFPVLAVDWQIDDHWRLANPFDADVLGPAGLELSYSFNDRWQLGGGGVYRSFQFRLDRDGVAPGGIGRNEGIAGFLRLRRTPASGIGVDFYLGAVLEGKLELEDQDGNNLSKVDYETAPFAAVTLSAEF